MNRAYLTSIMMVVCVSLWAAPICPTNDTIPPSTSDRYQSADRVFSADELSAVGLSDLWSALLMLDPALSLGQASTGADGLTTMPQESAVRGFNRWTTNGSRRQLTVVIDGARVPTNMLRSLSIWDISEVRVAKSPATLSLWTLNGGDGVIEVKTRKHRHGKPAVSYHLDAQAATAADEVTQRIAQQHEADIDGQTAMRHRHELSVEGGDEFVGYKVAARLAPSIRWLTNDGESNAMGLRTYVEYRRGIVHLHNDINFDHLKDEMRLEPTNQSSDKDKTSTLNDRLGISISLPSGFALNGGFSFLRQRGRRDIFWSPNARRFADNDDVRLNGTYHLMRTDLTTCEGFGSLSYDLANQHHDLHLEAGTKLFDATLKTHGYGGRGILSDRMNYVSFTQAYDTLQSPTAMRTRERTWQTLFMASYEYARRYGFTANVSWVHSSLLAPDEGRNAFYYGAHAYWNIHHEPWLRARLRRLSLALSHGTSGAVAFTDRDFNAHYKNDTQNPYIYNYYQTGAALQGLPNTRLLPATTTRNALSADVAVGGFALRAEVYHHTTKDMLVVEPMPLATGYDCRPSTGGEMTNRGVDIVATQQLTGSRQALALTATLALNYNRNDVKQMPDYFRQHVFSRLDSAGKCLDDEWLNASLLLQGGWNRWLMNVGVTRREYGTSTAQIGYRLPWKGIFSNASVMLTGENLLTWQTEDDDLGLGQWLTRRYTLSLTLHF